VVVRANIIANNSTYRTAERMRYRLAVMYAIEANGTKSRMPPITAKRTRAN